MGQVDDANRCARRICVFFLGWAVFVSSMNATACYFVTGMEHENAEIARGLRRRDADLLDRLIEQYQHRLLRYLVYLAGNREQIGRASCRERVELEVVCGAVGRS